MIENYDQSVKIDQNSNDPYVPDHPYRIFITGCSGSGENIWLFSLIKHQEPDIDRIYLHFEDPFESMYQLLMNGKEIIHWHSNSKIHCIVYKCVIDF